MSKKEGMNNKNSKMKGSNLFLELNSETFNEKLRQKNNNKTNINSNEIKYKNFKEKSTSKIDYRHYKSYPVTEIFPFSLEKIEKNEELYWLVTYDKLIKSKKILKILNYDIRENGKPIYTENNLIIKYMKIEGYEIFFVKGFDKPFIRPNKNSFILAKLYLLSIKEINKVLNYINKTRNKTNLDKYINSNNISGDNNLCEVLDIKSKNNNEEISYPYCYIYYIGMFMNKSMILFTNSFNYINKEKNNNKLLYSLPSSKKLYKLIKILIKSFPEYSTNFLLEYLIKRNLYKDSEEKKTEILNLLSLINIPVPNKNLLDKVLKETINEIQIQTNSSISKKSIHLDSELNSKNQNAIKNNKRISLKNQVGFKNSLKTSISGQIGSINYLSTNNTLNHYNSIKTLKNSFKNNVLTITIPNEINNIIKEKEEKESYKNCLTSSNINENKFSNYCAISKTKANEKNVFKKHKSKAFMNKGSIKINEDKINNIDIKNILNKKKVEFFDNKISNKSNINDEKIIDKNKKRDKTNKINNNKIYHTPKKKKKIKYYK